MRRKQSSSEKAELPARALLDAFGVVIDPRRAHDRDCPLDEVLFVAVVGVLCGADGWVGVELVCSGMVPWLRQSSAFEHGVPSHDTPGRVFRLLRPETLAEVLAEATERLFRAGADRHVAMDGKMARRSFTDGDRDTGMHMVTAWASDLGLSLGQVATDKKSNEQTAVLDLITLLDLSGCVVTLGGLRRNKTVKAGAQNKRLRAAVVEAYREELLGGLFSGAA